MKQKLIMLKKNIYDKGYREKHISVVKTLLKILENLQSKPDDMTVRYLPKTNKSIK